MTVAAFTHSDWVDNYPVLLATSSRTLAPPMNNGRVGQQEHFLQELSQVSSDPKFSKAQPEYVRISPMIAIR